MYSKNIINTLRVRGPIIVILSLVILAIVYSMYWYILSQNIKEGIVWKKIEQALIFLLELHATLNLDLSSTNILL